MASKQKPSPPLKVERATSFVSKFADELCDKKRLRKICVKLSIFDHVFLQHNKFSVHFDTAMSGTEEMFSRKARDRLSGALTSAVEGTDILDGLPDLTAGLDSPLRRIVKYVRYNLY